MKKCVVMNPIIKVQYNIASRNAGEVRGCVATNGAQEDSSHQPPFSHRKDVRLRAAASKMTRGGINRPKTTGEVRGNAGNICR